MNKFFYRVSTDLRLLMIIALIIPLGIAFPSASKAQSAPGDGTTPYIAVEVMPTFPGGNQALYKYIGERLRYPSGAQEKGIQGKVIVKFCVTAQGGVSMLSVMKSVDPELDQEAMRVIRTITKFNPGKKDGVAVPVWFLVPIAFALTEVK
jgi:protein TonB